MKKLAVSLALFILIFVSAPQINFPLFAQQPRDRYFPETEHHLSSPYLDYWETHNGSLILGAPITIPFNFKGIQVQYFQRGRLELRESSRVGMSNLVAELGYTRAPGQRPLRFVEDDNNTFVQTTGHTITGSFYDFYKKNGGAGVFGNPLSDFEIDKKSGQIVQYFERAIFEWQRDATTGNGQIRLRDFGLTHAQSAGIPTEVFAPEPRVLPTQTISLGITSTSKEHLVLRGESWNSIALANGTGAETLVKLNHRENNLILREGEALLIPAFSGNPTPLSVSSAPTLKPTVAVDNSQSKPIRRLSIEASAQNFIARRNQVQRILITVLDDTGNPLPRVSLFVTIHAATQLPPQSTEPSDNNGLVRFDFRLPPEQGLGIVNYDVLTASRDSIGIASGWFLTY